MSEYMGYGRESIEFLKSNNIRVGDPVRILSNGILSGILMPRYEHGDDRHIVVKLKSGYNIGIGVAEIEEIRKVSEPERSAKVQKRVADAPGLPKILLLSTGGTIASRIDYRTGAVTPVF